MLQEFTRLAGESGADYLHVVVTAGMGSCHCGDCYVRVFSDGTIQYQGSEKWQRSDRRPFMGDDEPYRPYNSRLTVEAYQKATARQTAMR